MFSAIQSQKPDKNIESQVDQTLYSWISFLILQINIWTREKLKYYKKGNITPRNQKMGIQDLGKNVQNKQVKDHDPSNHWPRASFKAYCPCSRAKSREGQCFWVCPVKNTIFLKKRMLSVPLINTSDVWEFWVWWLKLASSQPHVEASAAHPHPPLPQPSVSCMSQKIQTPASSSRAWGRGEDKRKHTRADRQEGCGVERVKKFLMWSFLTKRQI